MIALLAVAHVVNRLTVDSDVLRLDAEANLPTWASSLQFGLAGFACFAVAAAASAGCGRWTGVGGLLLVLSLDELATMHERLSAEIGATPAEWIVQPLAGLGAIALLAATGRHAGGTAQRLLLAAAGALVLAATAAHAGTRLPAIARAARFSGRRRAR